VSLTMVTYSTSQLYIDRVSGSKAARQTSGKTNTLPPVREKTLTFAAPSPTKNKNPKINNSPDDSTRQTEHYQKQRSDPTPQVQSQSIDYPVQLLIPVLLL